jgi:PAS domain S-box-containing protein
MRLRRIGAGDASPGLSRLCIALSLGSGLTVIALLVLVGIGLNRSFQDTMANAVTGSENFARLLEGHAIRTVRTIDQSLIGVQLALTPRPGTPPWSDDEINATLRGFLSLDGEFRNLSISNARGVLTHSAVPSTQLIDVSDRSFFLAPAQGHQGLFISEPFISRAGRGLSLAFSRQLRAADGSFDGIVVAAVDLQHFQNFYASINLAPGGTMSLWNSNGVMLARHPPMEELLGRPPPSDFSFRGLRASDPPSGTFRTRTITDNVDRMISYRRLQGYPLAVMASFSYGEVLARWQRQALYFGGAAGALAAAIILLTWAVLRELTRREQAETRFSSLVANVPGVVYRRRQTVNGDVSYPWISHGVRELLGWSQDEVIRDSTPLLDCIHEDDQAACKTAHANSAADLSPLNWEGRVRTKDGRQIWIQSISSPHRTKDGATEWDGVLLDITERKSIAEQRDESRRLLDDVIDAVPAVIGVKDLDLRYVLINKGLSKELNATAAQAIGKRRDDFPLPGVSAAENQRFFADVRERERRVLATGIANLFNEERVERLDGTVQTKLNSKIPLFDDEGRTRALLTVTIDISDRKEAEHALDESRRLLQAVVDAVPATVSVKDLNGRYLMINRALAQQFGCRPDDAIGRRLADFVLHGSVPEESAKLAERVAILERELLAEGKPRLSHEETVRLEDGTYWTGLSSKVPLRDSEGRVYALLSVVIDISDRKRAEQAVQQSRQLLQDVIDAVPAAIAVKDRDLRFILVNRGFEALYQTPASEIIGRRTGEFRGAENAALIEAMDREVLRTGKALPFREIESQSEEDKGRTYWMGKMPLRNADGQIFGTVGVALDISERKVTEDKLRQSQKLEAIGQLTGGLAHDFNNLLSIILGNLELLNERLEGKDMLRQLTQVAMRATLRGADLTQRLLAYARRQPLQPRRTDINQLVDNVAEILTRTLGETIQLETRLGSDVWATQIDPGQLENALINLAVNARDAMPKGGALTIETLNADVDSGAGGLGDDVAPGAYVLIAVSDTGVGMAPAVIERAFEPFFTTKETGKGSGLGLSMVYGFVRQSGGYVKIYSEVGRGTTVKLYLPRAAGDDQAVQAPRALDGVPTGHGERILIVEDNPAVQALVVHMVQALGYQAVAAGDGTSALGLLDGCPFDLLLTDVILPRGLGGPALAREARAQCPKLKVIYMSGYTESALLRDNAVEPYAILISKPFRKAELARRLHEALRAGA